MMILMYSYFLLLVLFNVIIFTIPSEFLVIIIQFLHNDQILKPNIIAIVLLLYCYDRTMNRINYCCI